MLRVRWTWAILMMTGRRGAATGERKVQGEEEAWEEWEGRQGAATGEWKVQGEDKGWEEWEGRWLVREGEGAGQGPGQRAEGARVGRKG